MERLRSEIEGKASILRLGSRRLKEFDKNGVFDHFNFVLI